VKRENREHSREKNEEIGQRRKKRKNSRGRLMWEMGDGSRIMKS
jgi:hypothetical protein